MHPQSCLLFVSQTGESRLPDHVSTHTTTLPPLQGVSVRKVPHSRSVGLTYLLIFKVILQNFDDEEAVGVPQGDSKHRIIAAASIIATVCVTLHALYSFSTF